MFLTNHLLVLKAVVEDLKYERIQVVEMEPACYGDQNCMSITIINVFFCFSFSPLNVTVYYVEISEFKVY